MSLLDHCYCINLKSRTDRWEESLKEFDRIGLKINRWEAFDYSCATDSEIKNFRSTATDSNKNKAAKIACLKSHLSIIEYARKNKFKTITIFEDDVCFLYDDLIEKVKRLEFHLPLNWAMFLYGASSRKTHPYKCGKFINVIRFAGCHSYTIKSSVYNYILDKSKDNNMPFDKFMKNIMIPGKVFLMNPIYCIQRESYSDLDNVMKRATTTDGIEINKRNFAK